MKGFEAPLMSMVELLNRDGLYHLRLHCTDEPFEVALHGIASEEQANDFITALTAFARENEERKFQEK